MPICPNCGAQYPKGALSCPHCGYTLPSTNSGNPPASQKIPGLHSRGDTICGDYRIEKLLRADHAGERYLGVHHLTKQPVTIEVLASALVRDPQSREQILAEAQVLSRFHHPTLPVMYTFREEKGRFYVVFQRPEGIPLSQRLAEKKPLSPNEAIKIFEQVLSGLHHTHQQGLFHGALRPSLLFINSDLYVMIGGFGFLKALDPPEEGPEKKISMATYMAPEVALGKQADHRTDLYHAGLLFFHAVTGTPPFTGANDYEIIRGHVETPPPDIRTLQPTVSPEISQVIQQSLVKDPSGRFNTAEEFRETLLRAERSSTDRRQVPMAASSPKLPSRITPPVANPPSNNAPSVSPSDIYPDHLQEGDVAGTLRGIPLEEKAPSGNYTSSAKHIVPSPTFGGAVESKTEKKSISHRSGSKETIKSRPAGPRPQDSKTPPRQYPALATSDFGGGGYPSSQKTENSGPDNELARIQLKKVSVSTNEPSVDPSQEPKQAPHQPQPAPAQQEPQPAPVQHQPQPAPVQHQPQPAPAQQQPQPAPAQHRPQPAPVQHQPSPAKPKRPGDSGIMYHDSTDERDFFAPPKPPVTNVTDDFSDLENPFRTKGNRGALILTLIILALVVLGGGSYVVHHFWLDPYANVPKDKQLIRPVSKDGNKDEKTPPKKVASKENPRKTSPKKEEQPRKASPRIEPPPRPEGPSQEVKDKAKKALAMWKKNRKKAISILKEVLKAYPKHEDARKKLASHYDAKAWSALNNGSSDTSLKMAQKALFYDPKATKSWFCMGFVMKNKGKKQEAKKAFNTYLNLCKTSKCSMVSYAKRYIEAL